MGLYQIPITSDVWHNLLKPLHNSGTHFGRGVSGVVAVGSAGSFLGCQRHLGGRGADVWTRPSHPKSRFLTFLPAPTANKTPELGALRKAEAVVTVHHPALLPPALPPRPPRHMRSAARRPTARFPAAAHRRSLWPWGRRLVAETGFMSVFLFCCCCCCFCLPKQLWTHRSHRMDQSYRAIWFSSCLWQMPSARCRRGKGKKCQSRPYQMGKQTLVFAQHFAQLPSSSRWAVPSTGIKRWSDL